ncbi:SDR family NAD(P)-dependent oxidoreductase [Streptomyces sp. NBC_01304]|uniref:SDR family NAD(P)-dependent oxidoreductase n=1 Tax=Streptomyces sp. NBC_01304 TaxID=2903818 RepID=UPI002E14AC8E|nr:glucose 1-dehydrogenase [Streptomyces sp. NBC_01304]
MQLAGKSAIVTGAKRGLGHAIAERFIKEGATVVMSDVLDATDEAKQLGGHFTKCDVSDEAQVKALIEHTLKTHGGLDILVNNAGIEFAKTILDTTVEEWDRLMGVNMRGVFLCSKHAIPAMTENGGGTIVNIASELGLVGDAGVAAYCASKGGVIQLTKATAIDHAKAGIRVNALCPGPIQTELLEVVFQADPDPEGLRKKFEELTLLGRLGRPDEVASAALFLASDQSSNMTGANLVLDGGWTTR